VTTSPQLDIASADVAPPNCPERGRIGREIAETVQLLIRLRAGGDPADGDIGAVSERLRKLRLQYRHHTKQHRCAERTADAC
jgi:hypothetical protein